MHFLRTEAFIIRTQDLGEADRIIVLYTADKGKLSGVARSARKSVKRFSGCMELMTRVTADLAEIEGRELLRIDRLELIQPSFKVIQDPEALATFSYIAELCDCFTQTANPCPPLFRLLKHVLQCASKKPMTLIARYFELWLLKLEGLFPDLANCEECGASLSRTGLRVNLEGDAVTCPGCYQQVPGGGVLLSANGVRQLLLMLEKSLDSMVDYRVFDRSSSELERFFRALIDAHAGRSLRSRKFLKTFS
ncbi:DNA repair protein RecO [Acidobacteriota bacterium]